ncbi:PREDICTED: multidrug resistance-associated protein 4-like [Acropora digitifera]|uniref:multidrug resistance-associated protein 4-like n=1 Tax=Acropora digitifera TaxID=70779 RepID=UPI00077AA512|nr:PREDICTED: multidrug resistance-associated protein 4-like [Acropora digitifera]
MRLREIELNAYNTFMFLAILNSIKTDVTWIIAQGAKDLADFSKALSRIQDLLEHDNIDLQKYLHDAFAKTRKTQLSNECKPKTVSLQNVVCSWSGGWNRPTLKSLCLKAENGDLLFITGPVGSGKSSVFCAILNEMPLLDGEISCQGRIAWVSQQPWVFSGTVRDNILFGKTFDSHKYRKTLEACDLDKDLERLPYGDMTRVGERGIVLSGGQRARVELARAVYSDADIYLLDDPLSAVDSNVGQHIFHNCIKTLLNGKTRLMITHNLQVLNEAKNIVFMKNGEKTSEGSFSALLQIGCDLQATSQSLERKQIAKVKNERSAPVLFFDTNPGGRILNRFSRDIGIMDELLPDTFLDALLQILFVCGSLALSSILNPWVIFPAITSVVIFILIARYYLRSARDLRRLEGVNRSPVLSQFSETLEGLVHIRAFNKQHKFLESLYRCQDAHNKTWFAIIAATRWLATQIDMICIVFVTFVVFLAILTNKDAEPKLLLNTNNSHHNTQCNTFPSSCCILGTSAFSIVYVLHITIDMCQYAIIKWSHVENYMTSVERVITYTQIEGEPGYKNDHQPPDNWPQHGQVRINNLGLVYYQGGPKILKDLSFTIDSQEKIGIVGRTGAGKSSFVAALFRIPQPTGDVIIDDVNIASINIQSSRQAMAVITQNPVLFSASLRMNLDPFEEEEAGLKSVVQRLPWKLGEEVRECGANFSVGEKQLLCLARALLKKNKIIVMDEATANVDHKTDQLIQETIRTKFKDCTVITIAHRLNTVLDYDRVLVMENGRMKEFDKPAKLLQNRAGEFSRLYHNLDNADCEDE